MSGHRVRVDVAKVKAVDNVLNDLDRALPGAVHAKEPRG